MVDEVKLLLAPEPSEACEFRSCDMIFLVKIYMHTERHCDGRSHNEKKIERKNQKDDSGDDDGGNEKVRSVISFIASIG